MIDVGESNGFQPVSVVSTCPSGMSLWCAAAFAAFAAAAGRMRGR